jgi:hypothetical protein
LVFFFGPVGAVLAADMLVARIRLKKAQAFVDKDVICLEIMGSVPFRRQITAVIDARSLPFYEAVLNAAT